MDRRLITVIALFISWSLAQSAFSADLRIGYQKSSLNLILLKSSGALEKRLAPQGIHVSWTEFQAGPQVLEALGSGSIDLGMTGDTPPIFAQAAGTNLVYVGNEPPKPQVSAILVGKDSPLHSIADLRGKRVAFQKGSSANYLVVRALESAGLKITDIQAVYLTPADGHAAFERGSVDAWAVWEPYYSAAQKSLNIRPLVTGQGLVENNTFYLAGRQYAQKNAPVIEAVFSELSKNDAQLKKNPRDVARILSNYVGIDSTVFDQVLSRVPGFQVSYVDSRAIDDQQHIADTFFQLGIVPRHVAVRDIVWHP